MLLSTLACADVLDIPAAPRLAPEQAQPELVAEQPAMMGGEQGASPGAPASEVPASEPPAAGEGVLPGASLGLVPGSPVAAEPPPPPSTAPPPAEPAPPEPCVEPSTPADVILILDNSGSMEAETAAAERELAGWAQRLSTLGLDYRLILLSRHRTLERSQSEAASTSICVEQPLSGLERCPSAAPVLGERFFHYSVKIDASDSFERALQGFSQADAAGLAPQGWSQWLRAGALKTFVEISDADSDIPAAQFAAQLSALAPEHFASGSAPGFVFHSVVGLADKASPEEPHLPEEPIESAECRSADTNPDNAGEQYQTLSVLTGGLRFPLCRLDALGAQLERIAADVAQRARRCTAPPGGELTP